MCTYDARYGVVMCDTLHSSMLTALPHRAASCLVIRGAERHACVYSNAYSKSLQSEYEWFLIIYMNQINNNNLNKYQMTLKINQNFKSIINSLLINSNKLNHSFQLLNSNLIINKKDFDQVDKLLNNNCHKYKVLQS